jgi:hypothetical protein
MSEETINLDLMLSVTNFHQKKHMNDTVLYVKLLSQFVEISKDLSCVYLITFIMKI